MLKANLNVDDARIGTEPPRCQKGAGNGQTTPTYRTNFARRVIGWFVEGC